MQAFLFFMHLTGIGKLPIIIDIMKGKCTEKSTFKIIEMFDFSEISFTLNPVSVKLPIP